jgi:hypothetical protein
MTTVCHGDGPRRNQQKPAGTPAGMIASGLHRFALPRCFLAFEPPNEDMIVARALVRRGVTLA